MDDLAAKIILEDEASGTLTAVAAKSEAARKSLESLGAEATRYDAAVQRWRVPKGLPGAGTFALPPGTKRPFEMAAETGIEESTAAAETALDKEEDVASRIAKVRADVASGKSVAGAGTTGAIYKVLGKPVDDATLALRRYEEEARRAATATSAAGAGTTGVIYKLWGKPVDDATLALRRYEDETRRATRSTTGTRPSPELVIESPEDTWKAFLAGSRGSKKSTDELKESLRASLKAVDDTGSSLDETSGKASRFGRSVRGAGTDSNLSEGSLRRLAVGFRAVASSITTNTFQGAAYNLSLVGRGLSGVGAIATGALISFTLLAKGFLSLVEAGARVTGISTAFDNMAASAGIASRTLVRDMQDASHGTLSQVEIMQDANRALMAGGVQITQRLPELLSGARVAAIANGADISYVFDSLVKGIVRGSPRLIDNADIYLRLGDALGEYASAIGKSVTELTMQERIQATLEATLRQLGAAEREMGLAGKTAAEEMQALPKSLEDIKNAAGAMLVEKTGVTKFFDDVSKYVKGLQSGVQGKSVVKDLQAGLTGVGAAWSAADLGDEMDEITAKSHEIARGTGSDVAAAIWFGKAVDDLITKYEELYRAQLALQDPEAAYRLGLQQSLAAWKAQGSPIADSTKAVQEFNNKLLELHDNTAGVTALAGQLAELANSADLLAKGLPEAPKLGGTLLTTDVNNLREYLDLLQQVSPAMGPTITKVREYAAALEQAQRTKIDATFAQFGVGTQALQRLAVEAFGVGASVADLAERFAELTPYAQSALRNVNLLSFALQDLQNRANQPIALGDAFAELRSSMQNAEAYLSSIAGLLPVDMMQEWRSRIVGDVAAAWREVQDQTEFGAKLTLQQQQTFIKQELAWVQQIATVLGQASDLSGFMIKPPNIGESALTTNVQALRGWANQILELRPDMAGLVSGSGGLGEYIDKLRLSGESTLQMAASMGKGRAALEFLAQAAFGADANINTLIERFKELSPEAQRGAIGLGILSEALRTIAQERNQTVTVDVAVQGLDTALSSIDSMALSLTGILSTAQIKEFRSRASADIMQAWKDIGLTDKFGQDLMLAGRETWYQAMVEGTRSAWEKQKKVTEEGIKGLAKTADELRGAIQSSMTMGIEVTQADLLDTAAGQYKDKAMESVRQLNAITRDGRAALSKNKDWIAKFNIPGELLTPNKDAENRLKAWAAHLAEDVKDLARPELIDWGAFVENWKAGQERAGKIEGTVDFAVNLLDQQGLLNGKTKEQAREDVRKAMGVEDGLRIETLFDVPDKDKTVQAFLAGAPALKIPAELEFAPSTGAQRGLPPESVTILQPTPAAPAQLPTLRRTPTAPHGVPPENIQIPTTPPAAGQQTKLAAGGVEIPQGAFGRFSPEQLWGPSWRKDFSQSMQTQPLEVQTSLAPPSVTAMAAIDFTPQGTAMADQLFLSFQAVVLTQTPGRLVASAWGADFVQASGMWSAVGAAAGQRVAAAFEAAMLGAVGNIRTKMAELIAPEVANILSRQGKRVGEAALP